MLVAVAVVVGVVEEGALREATEVVEQGGAEAEATWAVAAKVMVEWAQAGMVAGGMARATLAEADWARVPPVAD